MKDNTFFDGLRAASVIVLAVTLMATNLCAAVRENVLHSFSNNGRDGSSPLGGLIFDALGNLYGTTRYGGTYNSGAVFELMPKAGGGWSEKILYSFIDNNKDGVGPYASVVFDAKGNLYGTTCYGGTYGDGIIFELLPRAGGAWTEKVLHTFNGKDGGCSFAPLIFDANGNLFGTAYDGGAYGSGTVFELMPSPRGGWKEKVLYNFRNTGGYPQNGLTSDSSGNLYGSAHGGNGAGVVFKLTPKARGGWTESVIHSFHGKDGYDPEALIIDAAGNLYGTTYVGGSSGDGNVFELSPKAGGGWTVKALHSFSGKDGVFCYASPRNGVRTLAPHQGRCAPRGSEIGRGGKSRKGLILAIIQKRVIAMGILTGTTHGDAANALMAIYQEQARFAGHATQGSRRIPIHLLPSERLQRHRDRQAGQDSAAEIRPGMALTPAYIASERFLLPERNWRSFVVVATAHRSCFALERLFVLLLLPTSGLP